MIAHLLLVPLLACGGAPGVPAGARSGDDPPEAGAPPPPDETAPSQEPPPRRAEGGALPWPELLARDARISFTPRTASLAAADLDGGSLSSRGRTAALMALGLGNALRELPRLESSAVEGTTEERCAAVLALGELGAGVRARLIELWDDLSPEVAECALLAALRLDQIALRDRVDRIAGDPEHPLAEEARRILLFAIEPASAPSSRAARLLLELRWSAAQRYGLVDGLPYRLVLLGELERDEAFLDQVVLRGAGELSGAAVRDQLLTRLLEEGDDAAVRGAARGMPDQLAALMLHGLWEPDAGDWARILAEVGRDRRPSEAGRLLRIAVERSPERLTALELLARLGDSDELALLAQVQGGMPREQQVEAAGVWGTLQSQQAVPPLLELSRSADARVRAAALLNLARLDDPAARQEARTILLDPEHPSWNAWAGLALRYARDPGMQPLLEDTLRLLEPGRVRLTLASALAEHGRSYAASVVRDELADEVPEGPRGVDAVRSLARHPDTESRALLARLFPVAERPDLNVELALALIEGRDAGVLPILSAALWRDPFERSVLAAALVLRVGGTHTLRQELDRVPRTATSRDLRRVGFAMGLFGGIEEVQWLTLRRGGRSGDPVVQGAYLGALASRTL